MTVTPIRKADPTAAARARRYRNRRRAVTMGTVTRRRQDGVAVTVTTLVAALALAVVSAGFSIVGLTAVFRGAFWPVIGMGAALEGGKLAAVAWLSRRYAASPAVKVVIVTLVVTLMMLNAIGAYGFLARAHLDLVLADDRAIAARAADVDARTRVRAAVLADLDHRIAQIDGAVEEAVKRGRSNSAMSLAADQRRNRADLATARQKEAATLAGLQVEAAMVQGERGKVAADLGPVRYLAALIGVDDETVMRWFILLVAVLLDPLAVVLLLVATIENAPTLTPATARSPTPTASARRCRASS